LLAGSGEVVLDLLVLVAQSGQLLLHGLNLLAEHGLTLGELGDLALDLA
jgi:hypothetical protein